MKVIGLTGPIGAGKDSVARILRRHGALIVDADAVAHTLYSCQSPVWCEIIKAFGSKILVRGGNINRKRLGEIVFSDQTKLARLNQIVHPYLKKAVIEILNSREVGNTELIVINAAVLKEIGLIDSVDEVWVVMASVAQRLKRLLKSGFSKKEASARMRLQMRKKDYLDLGDVVIENSGTLRSLSKEVLKFLPE